MTHEKDMPDDALKQCPFCGKEPSTQRGYGIGGGLVRCSNIHCPVRPEVFISARSGEHSSLEIDEASQVAAESWNARPDLCVKREDLDAIRLGLETGIRIRNDVHPNNVEPIFKALKIIERLTPQKTGGG